MSAGHQHDFQRPSTKRTKEDIATISGNMVSVDEESLRSGLRELVRKTAQETLNALLDEEADEMVGAERYERTAAREAYRPAVTSGSSPPPAVHRPLLPQRVRQGAEAEADEGRQDAQGHPCAGIARGVGGEDVRGGHSLESMKLLAAAKVVREGCAETLACTDFPMQH